ncbi:MAG: hypothetical protein JNM99_20515 [Verrucomicrobiaceae bacterium]|nr:hypothetical protein [Verrucomicrobiaceae bacterium]
MMLTRRHCLLALMILQTLVIAGLVWTFRQELHQKLAARVPCRVLYLGDSIIAQGGIWSWHLGHWWPNDHNHGRPGFDLFQVNATAKEVLPVLRPQTVVVMGGHNDLARHDLAIMIRDYDHLLTTLRSSASVERIIVVSTLPDITGQFADQVSGLNKHLVATCEGDPRLTFLDLRPNLAPEGKLRAEFSRDGVHLNPQAYARWADALRPLIDGDRSTTDR